VATVLPTVNSILAGHVPAGREKQVRPIKMFGLTAIAVVAAMAFIGVSSASATLSTQICTVPDTANLKCLTAATTVHGIATEPLLDSSLVNVKCESSLAKASLLGLGNPQVAHIEDLTWTGCKTHGGTNCTVTTNLKGLLLILKLSLSDAHVESHGTTVTVKCGELINCSYGNLPVLLALSTTETAAATLHASTTVTRDTAHSGAFCPSSSTWLALYTSLTGEPLYIES
jgi:hypothetical protein